MLKRFIAHPLILGLFFLSVAGPLSAQNDSQPIQNDSRAIPPTMTLDGGPGPWGGGQCDQGPFQGPYFQGPQGPQGPWAYQGDSGWDGGDYSCSPPCFDSGCCFDNCGSGCACGRFVVGFEGLIWRVNEDNLGFAEKEHLKEKIVYTELPNGDSHASPFENPAEGEIDASKAVSITEKVGDTDANFNPPPPGATIYSHGKVKREDFDFKWKPGFRLCAAYLFPCNCWDLGFQWTHFFNSSSRSPDIKGNLMPPYGATTSEYTEEQIKPTFLPKSFTENQYVNHVDAHWRVRFNNFEVSFGRYICAGCGFGFHPYIAVKILDIEQRLNLDTKRDQNYLLTSEDYGNYEQRIKTEFQGVGFQGGFCADWCLGCGFSLYSNVSGGIVYGRAHVRERFESKINYPYAPEATYEALSLRFTHKTHVSRPNVDLGIGVRWQTCFCNCYYLGLKAGWEYHHYFDQNFFRFVHNDAPGRGDLAFHGFTFGADVSF